MMRLRRSSKPLAAELGLFWHGILGGHAHPLHFYSARARTALRKEVQRAISRYEKSGDFPSAERLARYWELLSLLITTQNEADGELPALSWRLRDFLHLLYAGEKPVPFWRAFLRRHRLPAARPSAPAPSAFWDYFEQFQPMRLDVAEWLCEHANGRILDVGAGAHSYLQVDAALDGSPKALKKNKQAKKKIAADLDSAFDSRLPPHSFDTITLNSVLAYVRSPAALLRRCRRLLKPGGVLLITNAPVHLHHPASFFVRRKVSARTLARELKRAGFSVQDHSRGRTVRLRAFMPRP